MLYEKIKQANVQAMKDKDTVARSIYSVLLNKIMLENIKKREKGLEVDDADVSNILQKTIKELSEEKENYIKVGNNSEAELIEKQIDIAKSYLPKMMSKEEIEKEINSLTDRSVPAVMKHFKQNKMAKFTAYNNKI